MKIVPHSNKKGNYRNEPHGLTRATRKGRVCGGIRSVRVAWHAYRRDRKGLVIGWWFSFQKGREKKISEKRAEEIEGVLIKEVKKKKHQKSPI